MASWKRRTHTARRAAQRETAPEGPGRSQQGLRAITNGGFSNRGIHEMPWTIGFDLNWNPNGEIMEYIYRENNLWLERLQKQAR
ncbi:MAG: hypothetical protein AUG08_15710 [Acidobacteria bacterium 13_1_20CM_2_55_15]|nr:MAG: hypothetical protein AUI45_09270 [Acidobacteria bacterium 13_1_40CM_2_56_11]OLE86076.1 MAG: hypothetical protein AUG08_15710 [Acidobacteria bacterium 13_1_20CM_2_55_15]